MPRRPGAPGVAEEAEDGAGTHGAGALPAPQRRGEDPSQYPGHQRAASEGRIDPRKALPEAPRVYESHSPRGAYGPGHSPRAVRASRAADGAAAPAWTAAMAELASPFSALLPRLGAQVLGLGLGLELGLDLGLGLGSRSAGVRG